MTSDRGPAPPESEAATREWRVVIVDDSEDERAEARRLLLIGSERRYRFVEAQTAAAGLREALGEPPDCLLLDYYLPDLDAPDVLAALAGPDGLTVCPVVVITGRAGAQLGPAVLRAGAQDYIGKDWVTPEGLTRAIENAAERWAMARALRASDERFRLAAQVAGLAVAEVDYAADQIALSAEAAALFGMPAAPAAVPRAAIHALFHPSDRLVLAQQIAASHDPAGTGAFEVDHRVVWPDGRTRWLGVRKQVFFAGGRPVRALVAMFDITARKEAEAQLRRNHETFSALIQNNPFGVYLVDADFRLRQVSQGARKAFASVQPLMDRDFGEVLRLIWAEPFATEVIGRFRHTLATGEPYTETTTMNPRADIDDVEAYDWRIERTTLPDGRFGVVCYFYDLSVRERWEAALLAKEQELRSLTDNTPDVLTRFDRDLRHVFANAAIERVTGHKPRDVIGKKNRELDIPAELADRWEAATRSVFDRGEPTSLEFTFHAPEGPRHYAARLVPEFAADGTVESVLGVSHDMTAQLRANAGVQEGEKRLRLALAAAQAGAWALEVKTGATTWSPENSALYGYDPARGPPTDWWERLHPDDRGRTEAAFADALAGRAPEFRSEFRVAHPTLGDRWLLGLGRVEFADTGEPVRLIGINLDVTDRKRAEQVIAEQDVRKDEFLATLAHELRNPLAPIRSGVSMLRMGAGPEQTEKTLGMIDRQLGHLVNLVDDLLDVSRVRSGKLILRSERVLLRDAVDGAIEACQSTIDAKAHTLKASFPTEPVALLGDKTRLVQVVANLLTNAAKYSEPGSHLWLSVERDGGEAVIRVADTGVGISREALPTVWDMFTQVRDTLDKAQGGLGIGLSLVKKLVLAHGGTVAVESEGVGRGSTFTVRLPVAPVEQSAAPRTSFVDSVAPAAITPALRVLVVDDNADGAEMLVMLLQRCGHLTQMAHTGPEALTAAGAFAPDVTFLDIGLPEMDGYEVARRLRADPVTAGSVLIALTGWGSEEDKRKSKEAGFDVHLTKPVDAGVVKGVLAQLTTLARVSTFLPVEGGG